MKQKFIYFPLILISINVYSLRSVAQEAPGEGMATPLSGNAMASANMANIPVNYYTGMPSISIPLFNYSDQNGLSLGINLDYSSGGIGVNASPATAGLGWNLDAGGSIVRTVRGMPDDYPVKGFLYAPNLPADFKTLGHKLYHDSIDAQQDIFQYSINGRGGKFIISKNKQIIPIPLSKIRIGYTTAAPDSIINSFYIITEDGVKYIFNEVECVSSRFYGFDCGYDHTKYYSSWNLSYMVAPFSTDTIKFYYQGMTQTSTFGLGVTGHVLMTGEDSGTVALFSQPVAEQSTISKKILLITFPDKKKVTFVYDPDIKYEKYDYGLNNIHISDSVFRYGYHFQWDNVHRSFLKGIRYYTDSYIKPGYQFTYNGPYFPEFDSAGDTLGNKRDHWGFYNGATNGTLNQLPTLINIYNGANREPDSLATASSLSTITDPSGGKTYYSFENNDIFRLYEVVPQYRRFDAKNSSVTPLTIRHVTAVRDSFTIAPSVFVNSSHISFSFEATMRWSITNADSSVVYATDTVDLLDFFLSKSNLSFTVDNLPNGTLKFWTKLTPGSTTNAHTLFINLTWFNQVPDTLDKTTVGGIRIKQIRHFDPVTGRTDTIATYKYELPNGRSAGFLGVTPVYNHLYTEQSISGSTGSYIQYMAISSDPFNNLSYAQGSPVGYSRVEVIKGSLANNLGKEVYEYSNFSDAGINVHPQIFPYAPYIQRDWALGLCKKISVYNNSGTLMQETENNYDVITTTYTDSVFRSLKLGLIGKTYEDGDSTENYDGEYYYPESGRADLVSSTQTFYYPDNSVQEKTQQVVYDTNYNAIKMISSYDQTRGLSLERRMYYPYNYTIGGAIGKLRDSAIYSVISSEDWITGDSIPRMVSASVTDFQQLTTGYIKPLALYALQSKSPLPLTTIGAFDSSVLIRNTTWLKKQQEFAAYDSLGNCIEIKNPVSGQSASIIMDYHNRLAVAKIANAKIADVAYTSFESDGKGNWSISSATRIDSVAVTGKRSYDLSNGPITKSGLNTGITYILSYWKRNAASVSVSGAAGTALIAEQNGWQLYTQTITSASGVTVSGSGLIDELRLYPKDANMATSTFEPLIGVTSTCDANNSITYYGYDSVNRLKVVRDKDMNVLKMYEYSDSLTARNYGSSDQEVVWQIYYDPVTGTKESACFDYDRYADLIMGEGVKDPDQSNCHKNIDAGTGLPIE